MAHKLISRHGIRSHETASTLTAQAIPAAPNGTALPLLANVTTFPADALQGSYPLIYVSNHNISPNVTDPRGDTIAIFEFVNATSTNARRVPRRPLQHQDVPTGLQQIRSMALERVDDSGDEYTIAGANTVGGFAVFQRVDGGQNLTLITHNVDLENRTNFVFVEPGSP
ncbi:putative isomerase YbhE [Mycena sanguinolenta]|uniref:Putative isomerase YbhE n=1 Tax=Mycena sanguinolenta TaxID=230812 RepID=A0A8H6ZEI0_9AGAR|nr:putative isomerase YbhE [Mycena sanguinolenta]